MALPSAPGTYVVVLHSRRAGRIRVGRAGTMRLRRGYYLYVGSAFGPGGLRARVAHHLRRAARAHWHIDYLRQQATPVAVWYQAHGERCEHVWAQALGAGRPVEAAWPGFGASDCRCPTHLFFTAGPPDLAVFRRRLARRGSAVCDAC